jgi:polysaccharide deacetylase 2 family uncharacterized protein YibQ
MPIAKTFSKYLTTVLLFSSAVFASASGKLVLVLDDLGNQLNSGKAAIELPWVTTVAIMPGRPYTHILADHAHALGKEIIIHAPMSNSIDFPLGPMGLSREHGKQSLIANLKLAIQSVPHAVGLSNHMGSRLTQDFQAMSWIMSELRDNEFYYFDSRTVSTTVGWEAASHYAIPWAMRQYFLDHYQDPSFMASQWAKAVSRAKAGENITVICHPYPETLAFLSKLKLSKEDRDYLVPLSSVLHYPTIVERAVWNLPQGS